MGDLERSLRRFGVYAPLSQVAFWMPVFFLYFSERFSIEEVLWLESFYYASVVLLEVPSGYLSDRLGRRATLLCSAGAMATGYTLFLFGGTSFLLFALAQLGKAVGYAFLSGTDAAFHYDTLAALGREDEYAEREARLLRNGYVGAAAGAVLSGLLATFDLRIAYGLSLLNAGVMVLLVLSLREPPRQPGGWATDGMGAQLLACTALLRKPLLLWLFAYFVLKITLEHIPYEFAQPYLAAVLGEPVTAVRNTPAASGLLFAVIAIVGSIAANYSIRLRRRLGLGGALLGAATLQTGLIAAMAVAVSPLVVPLIAFRSSLAALSGPILRAEIAPRVPQARRATYLSLHSLAGRLGYSAVLLGLSFAASGRSIDAPSTLQTLLSWSLLAGVCGLALLLVTRRALREGQSTSISPSR